MASAARPEKWLGAAAQRHGDLKVAATKAPDYVSPFGYSGSDLWTRTGRRAALAQELFAVAAVLAVRRRADDTGAIGAVRERRRHGALRHPQLQIVVQVRRPLALEDRLQLHAVLPDDRACGGGEQIRVAVLVPARLRLLAEDLPVLTGQIRGVRLPGGDARHREGRLHRS